MDTTPIEKIDNFFVKREDLYTVAGARGGKARACWHLATEKPYKGLITASARKSPQAQIVARIAAHLGIPARCHMPTGAVTPEMEDMLAHGAELIQHKAGYNNVIIARATEDYHKHTGWRYIPFGMEDRAAIACTSAQVKDIPKEVRRIIIPIGSGMSAIGVLHGLRRAGLYMPVIGISVGADPIKRLRKFGPFAWHAQLTIIPVTDRWSYDTAVHKFIEDIDLDPIYEAKCADYIEPGDLFWIVGRRTN